MEITAKWTSLTGLSVGHTSIFLSLEIEVVLQHHDLKQRCHQPNHIDVKWSTWNRAHKEHWLGVHDNYRRKWGTPSPDPTRGVQVNVPSSGQESKG